VTIKFGDINDIENRVDVKLALTKVNYFYVFKNIGSHIIIGLSFQYANYVNKYAGHLANITELPAIGYRSSRLK